MNKIIPFPENGGRQVCTYPVFRAHAAEVLRGYSVDEDTIASVYALLQEDDAYHALKELRPYMDMDRARETTIDLKVWMEGRA